MHDLPHIDNWSRDPHRRLAVWAMRSERPTPGVAELLALDPAHGDLVGFAERNQIAPILAAALLETDALAPAERDRWQAIYDAGAARWAVLQSVLDEVAAVFAAEDIALIGLKNVAIARAIYPEPVAVPMGDLDVLIDVERFREAHALLVQLGFRLDSTDPSEAPDLEKGLRKGGTEYLRHVDGVEVAFELQWRPVSGRWLNRDQEPSGAELVGRSVPMEGTRARMLEPTDNMLQVALHTAKHTYCRAPGLRLHCDVDRLARFAAPDWDALVERCRQLECGVAVYFSLAIAAQMLGSPVPDRVLDALRPPGWQVDPVCRMLRRADIFEPGERKFNLVEVVAFYSLLHDTPRRFLATVLNTDAEGLTLRRLPRSLKSGLDRLIYLTLRRPFNDPTRPR